MTQYRNQCVCIYIFFFLIVLNPLEFKMNVIKICSIYLSKARTEGRTKSKINKEFCLATKLP